MNLCERCGNEYPRGNNIKKEGKVFIKCPYCGYHNKPMRRKKKSKY